MSSDHATPNPHRTGAAGLASAPGEGDELSIRSLPRARMQSKLGRLLFVGILVQAVVGLSALVLLQSAWRHDGRLSQSESLVRLAASQLQEESMVSVHPATQRTLDKAANIPSIRFAVIVDSAGRLIRGSEGAPDGLLLGLQRVSTPRPDGQPSLVKSIPLQNTQVFEVPLRDEVGQGRWLLVGVRDVAAERAMLDGACALGAVALAACLIQVPIVLARFRRWTASLRELHTATRRLALGVASKPVVVSGDDEVAYFALAFNDMAGKLLAGKRALIDANHRLEDRVAERTEELGVANAALERQNVHLAQVTETALRFTDDVAHEFRTPLTVVSEFASLMVDGLGGVVTPKQTEYLSFITDASRDLARLVDDFLDSSKLRARSLRVVRREESVGDIVEAVWPMLQTRAATASVSLTKIVDPTTPTVYADAEKVGRAIVNLTINAIKFSGPGTTVTVHAGCVESGGAQIAVTDEGPGLNESEVASLFERFRQTGAGRNGDSKGFGLGLSIVRELVTLNLGTISITSARGKGSTFAIALPPNEPEAIVDTFLSQARQIGDDSRIGILRVVPDGEVDEALQLSLAALAYPLDIQLLAPDRRTLLLFGVTRDVHRWAERLLAEHAQDHGPGSEGGSLRIDLAIAVPPSEARGRILAALIQPAPVLEALAS